MADAGQIGKYQIVAPLGSGGFATVYKALDTSLGREVALKILHPQLLVDKGFVERFFREARTLAALRHPNIIIIHEVGTVEGRTFLAMELAASSLAQLIAAEGARGWPEVCRLIEPAALALDFAHERGVVHRDVKPANVLLADDGRVLLTDFGFARAMGDVSTSMSASSAILGTPSYIAPELWDGRPASTASDIYALACVAYELFAGRVLFPGSTPLRAVAAHAVGPQLPDDWSPPVLAVFRAALAREPGERFQRAGLFATALREATQPTPIPAPPAPSPAPVQTAAQLVAAPPKPRTAPRKATTAEPAPEPQARPSQQAGALPQTSRPQQTGALPQAGGAREMAAPRSATPRPAAPAPTARQQLSAAIVPSLGWAAAWSASAVATIPLYLFLNLPHTLQASLMVWGGVWLTLGLLTSALWGVADPQRGWSRWLLGFVWTAALSGGMAAMAYQPEASFGIIIGAVALACLLSPAPRLVRLGWLAGFLLGGLTRWDLIGTKLSRGETIAQAVSYYSIEHTVRDMITGGMYGAVIGVVLSVGWWLLRRGKAVA